MSRFSLLYDVSDELRSDSPSMRLRIGTALDSIVSQDHKYEVRQHLVRKIGQPLKGFDFAEVFADASLKFVLDAVTVFYNWLSTRQPALAANWKKEVEEIFREERVSYRVDAKAIVHYLHDKEVERSRGTAIAVLRARGFTTAELYVEASYSALAEAAPNGREAIRSMFDAVESVFRAAFTKAPKLSGSEVDQYLDQSFIGSHYAGEAVSQRVVVRMVKAFKEWVTAAHNYRHAQGDPEPVQPPLELALQMVETGAAHLRWLAQVTVPPPAK